MPKSAAGTFEIRTRHAAGLTLVEMLVVVLIGAILTGLAIVRFQPFAGASAPADETARLLARLEHACDRALLTGNPRGLEFLPDGYAFRVAEAGGWREARAEEAPPPRRWPQGMRSRVQIDGTVATAQGRDGLPQVVCTGVEPPVPFELELIDSTGSSRVRWP